MMVAGGHLTTPPLLQTGAMSAPVLRLHLHRPGSGHGARSAVRIAGRPGAPRTHLTIHH